MSEVKNSSTFYICLIVVLLTLTIFNISLFFFKKPQVAEIQYVLNNPPEKQITFWHAFLDLHPTYFEGWVQLTKLELQTGNTLGAQVAFSKARKINPNSEEVTNLKKELYN